MPRIEEQRLARHFGSLYNSAYSDDPIVNLQCEEQREAPDAICTLASGRVMGLELTSVWAPKRTTARKTPHKNPNLEPLVGILNRKLGYDYRTAGVDGVWLFVHLRLTLPRDLIEEAIRGIKVPIRFDKVFLEGPIPGQTQGTNLNVLELPDFKSWSPNLSLFYHLPSERPVVVA
jgi:hypothetical protein